jgi:polysaccharide biosynthesis/export protein
MRSSDADDTRRLFERGADRMAMRGRLVLCTLIATHLSGCNVLPAGGPRHRDISSGAAAGLLSQKDTVAFNYVLLDINRVVLDHVADIGPGSLFRSFGKGYGPAPVIRVGVGDVVQIAIFESSSGGLFIPSEAGVRPGNFVTLPTQEVDRAGNVTVPYAGQVPVVGRTVPEIQSDIEVRLAKRAIEPQVVVTLLERNASEVTVVGDVVNAANRFRVRPGGERVLDMIARAGGLRYPGYELFVTLQRGKQRTTVYFPTLVNRPEENIFVAPGDTVYVFREQQRFVAVGALGAVGLTTGLTGQYAFEQERLSLNEAVARAGGLLDVRANPGQVFLYRIEHRDMLERLQLDLRAFPTEQVMIPVVYRANFRDPSSFFFAQSFPMRHKDVIYVSNADAVEVSKFLVFLQQITSTASGVSRDIIITQDPSGSL